MFGLFNKKKKELLVHDKIWLTDQSKFKFCIDLKKSDPNVIFVAWFEETKHLLQDFFEQNNIKTEVYLADRLSLMQSDKEFIFVEHHPLHAEEQKVADKFAKKEITVLSSLAEPIFKLFGGDKMIHLLQKMGMKEDEMIEHAMITNSIKKAQEKIATKSTINFSAKSQKEWFSNAGVDKI